MIRNEGTHPKATSWAWPAALLATGAAAGLWWWQTQGAEVPVGLTAGLLGLAAVLGGAWVYRVRAARRLFAALDNYAAQELTRAERRPHKALVAGGRAFARRTVGTR